MRNCRNSLQEKERKLRKSRNMNFSRSVKNKELQEHVPEEKEKDEEK